MTTRRKPGLLSVHQEHELLLKLEEAGLNGKSAQKIIESGGNKLARQMLSLVPHDTIAIPNLNEAMSIVGQKNFFGPNQWRTHFGDRFSIPQAPPIPWTRQQLESLNKEYFLFLGVNKLSNAPLNLVGLNKIITSKGHPKLGDVWYLSQGFAQTELELKWYLMPIKSVPIDSMKEADIMSTHGYTSVIARVVANILFFIKHRRYLDRDAWVLCSDSTNGGSAVYVRGFEGDGITIFRPTGVTKANFGYALTKK